MAERVQCRGNNARGERCHIMLRPEQGEYCRYHKQSAVSPAPQPKTPPRVTPPQSHPSPHPHQLTQPHENVIDVDKQHIISLFKTNVKGVKICLDGQHIKHCGKEGHWLETQMGIKHNAKNEPDINGYEMKKDASKTTLGDFSASEYAFSGKNKRTTINQLNNWTDDIKITRTNFIQYFGNPNPIKHNRYSWSGRCVPTYNNWNTRGQNLVILENNDIIIYYSFSKDTISRKVDLPHFLQRDNIVIAIWKVDKLKPHINDKFNKKGFFVCK